MDKGEITGDNAEIIERQLKTIPYIEVELRIDKEDFEAMNTSTHNRDEAFKVLLDAIFGVLAQYIKSSDPMLIIQFNMALIASAIEMANSLHNYYTGQEVEA